MRNKILFPVTKFLTGLVFLVLFGAISFAQPLSTDKNNPTELTNKIISGKPTNKEATYYYSFFAGPGTFEMTVQGKANRNSSIVEATLFDSNKKQIGLVQITPESSGQTKSISKNLNQKEKIILRVELDPVTADNVTFQIALDGAVSFSGKETTPTNNNNGEVDFSMRKALYFTQNATDKIDLKNHKYVADGETMQLSIKDSDDCTHNICSFNIGFIAFRQGNTKNAAKTYGVFKLSDGSLVGNTIAFSANQKTKEGIFKISLKTGMNKVTFTIDPENKTAESDENNNSLKVNFNVVGGVSKIPSKPDSPNSKKPPVKTEKGENPPDETLLVKATANTKLTLALLGAESKTVEGQEYTVVSLTVTDRSKLSTKLFADAPDLPPCGENKNSSRSWLEIYNADNNKKIGGYCNLSSNSGLKNFSFGVPKPEKPPQNVYVTLTDRKTGLVYKSNCINAWSGKPCKEKVIID